MKATYKFILAAFAATVALSSCTKEIAADRQDTGSQDGLRKIAVSFGTPTKTSIAENGFAPEFKENDAIMVADQSGKYEKVSVSIEIDGNDTVAVFYTRLEGELYAVYPVDAAVYDEGRRLVRDGFKIKSQQYGLFEEANIATGVSTGENMMTFNCQTAVLKFYVGSEIGVNQIMLEGLDDGNGNITMLAKDDGKTPSTVIEVNLDKVRAEGKRICYVAVNPVGSGSFMVRSYTSTQTDDNSPLEKVFNTARLESNILTNVFIPYFVKFNNGQKWAYCNVGAFLPEESGHYFSWGNTFGCYYENGRFLDEEKKECSFTDENYKGTNGNYLLAGSSDIPVTESYDAARSAWGEGWRIPTAAEAETLVKSTSDDTYGMKIEWYAGDTDKYNHSCGLCVASDTKALFFPVAGYGFGDKIESDTKGYYWTSSRDKNSFTVGAGNSKINVTTDKSYFGYLIRPIYDSQVGPDDPDDPVPNEGMKFQPLTEYSENI